MARKPRLNLPNAFYHVMLRGNNADPVFFEDEDYLRFFLFLQRGVERFNHKIHAFCLMKNHVHLLMQAGQHSISPGMQQLVLKYTIYVNKKHNRIGHLFQGRFKSIIVHDEGYLRELIRYIHLNPVSADIVTWPEEYRWSSYKYYLNHDNLPWLSTDWILSRFSHEKEHAKSLLKDFILRERTNRTYHTIPKQPPQLEGYVHPIKLQTASFTLSDLIEVVCRHFEILPTSLQQKGKGGVEGRVRSIISILIRRTSHLTLQEFAQWSDRDGSNLTKAARKMESDLINDKSLKKLLELISQELQMT